MLFASKNELRRLIVAPRPFDQHYRLVFGSRNGSGAYSVRSITDEGQREYQILGQEATYVNLVGKDDIPPNRHIAPWALPVAFHPAGHILLWEDAAHCFQEIVYGGKDWEKVSSLSTHVCGGSLTITPNGLGLIHWQSGIPGVGVYLNRDKTEQRLATGFTFLSTPSSVPDGKGIVGLVQTPTGTALAFVPLNIPLADVVNAWMFTETPADQNLFAKNSGLFRTFPFEQIYSIYDSENYRCGGYDYSAPTRPYFVTTDILWEVFSAAYEGTFVLQERRQAIPAFWAFVDAANQATAALPKGSPWSAVFQTISKLRLHGTPSDPEVARIAKAAGTVRSSVIGKDIDYSDLTPRGHYTSTPELSAYFKAFRYLTLVSSELDTTPLTSLPSPVKLKALQWIGSYKNYVAPSRSPLVWSAEFAPPSYSRHPGTQPTLFPLSWGFDNEALQAMVYHDGWPADEQIAGASGPRLTSSGLDVAAALGSNLAHGLLADQIKQYPPLAKAISLLRERFNRGQKDLYSAWISALAIQWADRAGFPGGIDDGMLWQAKRLQTGLASWATLRHATVLVNERMAAECGEGGFEEIEMRPPRGYVEPDPETFAAMAALFENLSREIESSKAVWQGDFPDDQESSSEKSKKSLSQGILNLLHETAAKARLFQKVAEKELRNEALTEAEYEEILYVGRVAEHHFLVYKSLANKNLAISDPDPIAKIADVAGGGGLPYVESAVGQALEWDQIVPFFGRREIVKGSVYSYYEFTSPTPLTDTQWRKQLKSQPARPQWIAPYISPGNLSCPAKPPF
ncbi:MAG TPA: DUF3160 domain-containing protein [Candidatus Angelobacter sp.]|nr:DUF3160 domain-containing protein [Candidatus Angelobacter sp.]